jgi:2'-5' RNA ligase
MKILDLLTEKTKEPQYGCVMAMVDFNKITEIHDIIEDEDIYEGTSDDPYGLETEPHVTILYGLHEEVNIPKIREKIKNIDIEKCILTNPSLFENEQFDVLKFDVKYFEGKSKFLHLMNKNLKSLPHTSNYPKYNPHMTIAYLKPGRGKKYVNLLKDEEHNVTPKKIVYSYDNKKSVI